jgi:non-homologous end joining protein Ku
VPSVVSPDSIDPIYLSGQVYLVPEGAVGQHPFNLIREGMVQLNRWAVEGAENVVHALSTPKGTRMV